MADMRKFEAMVAKALGPNWVFEEQSFEIKTKVRGQVCLECGCPMYRIAVYTPDFTDGNNTVIEVKGGSFKPVDQARYKRFVKQHPELKYVICFRSNIKLRNLKDRPTVKQWGEMNNIPVVVGIEELKEFIACTT